MLLKYTQAQKRMKLTGSGKPQRATGMMKLTSTMMNVVPRMHRKVIKNVASKRPNSTHRIPAASKRHELRPIPVVPVDPCDNSNDSGLGFDQHIDYPLPLQQPVIRFSDQEICWSERIPNLKRQRLDIKLESDDANDNFSFPTTLPQEQATSLGLCTMPSRITTSSPPSLTTQLSSITRDGRIQLQIVCQPEQQHRARYQTEGSRGAVKDRSGNGFPVVKLIGYDKPAIIQVFIGTDQGRVVPHMFYQACRVSGKNSTPCLEKKIDGTVVIEIETAPERDMIVTCDCVGILKERNVDVEHRFPDESPGRSKKKSTRCRMVFRTNVLLNDGTSETLQVTSQPIVCTQPPGIPEIGKKSLIACPATGGLELYVFGKNFLKDTRVVFQQDDDDDHWESVVQPDKEFLQQSHLVCTIPPYKYQDIQNPVTVRLVITSSGKNSEPHDFTYTPPNRYYNLFPVPLPVPQSISSAVSCDDAFSTSTTTLSGNKLVHPVMLWPSPLATSQPKNTSPSVDEEMPPPPPLLPLVVRRPSVPMIVPEAVTHEELKQETTETPQTSPVSQSATTQDSVNDTRTCAPSVSTLQEFVSEGSSLPPISVENYLTGLDMENNSVTSYTQKRLVKPQMMIDTGSSATQLHPISILSDCNPDLVHSQMMNDIPPQSSASQMLPSSVITNHNTASNLPQTHILTDMSPQHTTSHLNSPPIINTSGTIPSPVKQTRYSNSLLSSENNGQPISTSLLMTTDSPMQFSQSLEANRTATQCINDLLASRNTSPELQQTSSATLISDPQSMRLSDLVVSSSVVQANTTERLDAFVNSAAESHISPGQSPLPPPVHISPVASDSSSSPPPSTSSITSQTAVSQEGALINPLMQGVQTSCTNTSIANTSLCSLLTGPPMTTIQQSTPTTIKCDLTQTIHPNPLTSSARISDLMVSQSISSEMLRTGMNVVQSNLPTSTRYNEEQNYSSTQVMETDLLNQVQQVKPEVKEEYMLIDIATTQCSVKSSQPDVRTTLTTSAVTTPTLETPQTAVKKNEEGIPLGSGIQELTQMSENDLISYINPSCFDQV